MAIRQYRRQFVQQSNRTIYRDSDDSASEVESLEIATNSDVVQHSLEEQSLSHEEETESSHEDENSIHDKAQLIESSDSEAENASIEDDNSIPNRVQFIESSDSDAQMRTCILNRMLLICRRRP